MSRAFITTATDNIAAWSINHPVIVSLKTDISVDHPKTHFGEKGLPLA
jgi:hypothetical protein